MKKPSYVTSLHAEGDASTDRKNFQMPTEIYDNLISLALELGFAHKGKASVATLLRAVSELLPEELESVLEEADLMPKRKSDPLW
jgi:hypothetical protein